MSLRILQGGHPNLLGFLPRYVPRFLDPDPMGFEAFCPASVSDKNSSTFRKKRLFHNQFELFQLKRNFLLWKELIFTQKEAFFFKKIIENS